MMTRRREERGGMFVCVVMQRDWETRESEKRDNKHKAGFFLSLFFGGGHSLERETHIIIILHTTNNI